MVIETETTSITESAARLQASLLQIASTSLDGMGSDRMSLLGETAPYICQLRAITRVAHDQARIGKRKVADSRLEVDDRSLALQNLKYQKRHLEEEIRMCRDFRSIYQTIPLADLEDFKAREPVKDKTVDILDDAHSLQLARLRFELSERKRLEGEKQSIQADRSSLIKENKEKKQRLEELERDLKEMLTKSEAIWQRFQEPEEDVEAEIISTQDTPLATDGQT